MDFVPPAQLLEEVAHAGRKKALLAARPLLIKAFLSGALLAYATAFAFRAAEGFTGGAAALVAAAVFPVGFGMIVLLGLELVTGNFALLPVALVRGEIAPGQLARSWALAFVGNMAGSLFVGALLAFALTGGFHHDAGALGAKIIAVAEAKTLAYREAGGAGWATAVVKAILCNWMVAMGTVLGLSSRSTVGKITAIWLPIMTFFGLALEHSVVNMFVIPMAMMLGAPIGLGDWWWWNQIPVTLGNVVGGALLTGLALHAAYGEAAPSAEPEAAAPAPAASPL